MARPLAGEILLRLSLANRDTIVTIYNVNAFRGTLDLLSHFDIIGNISNGTSEDVTFLEPTILNIYFGNRKLQIVA